MEYTGIGEEELTAIKEVAVRLAETGGITTQEACSKIINAMQFLSEGINAIVERLAEIFVETCESCKSTKGRRTRHGSSSRTEKPRKARITVKWREKYRPP